VARTRRGLASASILGEVERRGHTKVGEDAMRPNRLRQIWRDGGAAVNGWLQLPHGFAAEVMAAQGWDSLTIDMQHGPVGYDVALTMLQAMSASDVTPLARVPWNEPGIIMKMLDGGCYGIICPMVNSTEEAQRFVGACRYPPKGYRSFGPTRVSFYAGADYPQHANDTVIALAMIETAQAIENLDAILDTPGLDGVYIGPADLSQSLGYQERVDPKHPDLVAVLDKVHEGCRRRGLITGIHVASVEYARGVIDKGFQFVTLLSDGRLLAVAAKDGVDRIKGGGGQQGKAAGPY
jgi:4-hydroxy-2-oxoheptanedioate aldolase